uniref:Uncharacterized protein n=1 Tax=Cajanus cajan TaxID=3821 RepID=A0A151R1S8_CAJCA|nr:hypothetical protein KK1_042404 [Cajanus cajan]
MWREGQSFEDAFHYVKNARGVTNPNMGFACQLLQCQKRVHAMPVSPSSVLRMYRMAPHSPYDPLHLVPKTVYHPSPRALDSRGAFIVHVPSAIYVWCGSVMSCNANSAAAQVVRYERATGKLFSVVEDDEPKDFWVALLNNHVLGENDDGEDKMELVRPRRVEDYDLDFAIFHKALAGGVVPPFALSNAGSENCLPARENGWGRLTRKLASGIMKGLFTSSKCCESGVNNVEEEVYLKNVDSVPLPKDNVQVMDHFVVAGVGSAALPPSPRAFACFLRNSPKLSSQSPTISPNSSDCASSFSFSPSSTDFSLLSPRLPSPSGVESVEPFYVKDAPSSERSYPSIAERRGSKPPPMLLPSASESSRASKIRVRSGSFSLAASNDTLMEDVVASNLTRKTGEDS